MKFSTSKLVADPILGLIDITQFLPMIDVKEFQSLALNISWGLLFFFSRRQPIAGNSIVSGFKRTKNLMHHWLKIGMITPDQYKRFALMLFTMILARDRFPYGGATLI